MYEKYGVDKRVWEAISSKDFKNNTSEIPWLDKPDAGELVQHSVDFKELDNDLQEKVNGWIENGYLVLESFYSEELIDNVNAEIEDLISKKQIDFNFTGRRLMDAYKYSKAVDKLFKDEELLKIFKFILGKDVKPFQTINFLTGSEQKAHSDSIHMTTEPKGYLIASWTALEDVKEGSGELHYYPGSHKLPYLMSDDFDSGNTYFTIGNEFYKKYEAEIEGKIHDQKLEKKTFLAKKGDVFIWHANLLHGGNLVTNNELTRKSQVAHYYADGVICYHEITQRPAIINN